MFYTTYKNFMFLFIFAYLFIILFSSLVYAQENVENQSILSRLHTSMTLDNSGTSDTERLRANALIWLDSLFKTDDRAHFGYYTAPTKPLDLSVAYGGYRIPWGGGRNTAELSGYISNQNFTT
jgi:hemolysin activation/secretion protein